MAFVCPKSGHCSDFWKIPEELTVTDSLAADVLVSQGFQLPLSYQCKDKNAHMYAYESGNETVAVLLPGFAINW